MPRPGQVRPKTDERLSDRIAVGLLTRSFPPELVDQVVAECGRSGQRNRLPPQQHRPGLRDHPTATALDTNTRVRPDALAQLESASSRAANRT
ncbi:transposase domain-containing protein [Streptomyces sp. TRM76323]|uniref:Transposase domain-containing protein n=1 Tax=Streptomyces tamarix TaxID=3078565 RepID=A0ABU3QJ01_9ACTN|nr:transposase domain-containing protein [Streptomyces tamarix]MDT9682750.1 transposase domain-containing protein [Streptomyces tamarix]